MTPRVLPTLIIVWIVAEQFLTRRSGASATSKDRGSLWVLWLVQMTTIGSAVAVAINLPGFRLPAKSLFYVIGICLFVMGLGLRLYSIKYLGRFFTRNVAIAVDHRLIDSGPYRLIRHPSYTGALILFFGLGLGLGNWLSVVIIIVPIFLAFCWRTQIEEAALLEALGEPYRIYMAKTKRLVPMIY